MEDKPVRKTRKHGKISDEERKFIFNNAETKDDRWIAEQLHRTVEFVEKYRRQMSAKAETAPLIQAVAEEDDKFKALVRSREDWQEIQKQYTDNELKLFEFYWCRTCKQLPDMTHTEEMQAIKLIHFEMAMNRTLQAKKKIVVEMELVDEMIAKEMQKAVSTGKSPPAEKMATLEERRALLVADEQARTKEFNDTMERYNKLMSHLKVTRDQRFAKVENSKFSFADWIRTHNEEKLRKKEAQEAELSRIAAERVFQKFGKLHQFADGEMDRPILNAETVLIEEKAE